MALRFAEEMERSEALAERVRCQKVLGFKIPKPLPYKLALSGMAFWMRTKNVFREGFCKQG